MPQKRQNSSQGKKAITGFRMEKLMSCIRLIENEIIRNFVVKCLGGAPKYFWRIPASSSGKYHPLLSLGNGGLVRHTIKAVEYGAQLCKKNSINGQKRDMIIAALILHDTCKAGIEDTENHSYYQQHAYLPRKVYEKIAERYTIPKTIFDLIDSHMGQWSEDHTKIPRTKEQRIVHFADFLASRKNQPIVDFGSEIRQLETYDKSIAI